MMCSVHVVLLIMNLKEIHMFFFAVSILVHYIYLLWYTVSKYIDLKTRAAQKVLPEPHLFLLGH